MAVICPGRGMEAEIVSLRRKARCLKWIVFAVAIVALCARYPASKWVGSSGIYGLALFLPPACWVL